MPSTPPPSPALIRHLEQLAGGETTVDAVARAIGSAGLGDDLTDPLPLQRRIDGATVDLNRRERCGFGEVVFGEGKSAELITKIVQTQLEAGQDALVTRVDSTTAAQMRRSFAHLIHNPHARTVRIGVESCQAAEPIDVDSLATTVHVAVVTAGSTDAAIAEEAIETLTWMGVKHHRFDDIGVAGPARLLAATPRLRHADVIVVVAGMEGALPSVVAGHVAVPVFAVPTSVGYGANLGGLTPLMGMLSACAANVAVVNVDAGFKGGYLAGLVASRIRRAEQSDHHE